MVRLMDDQNCRWVNLSRIAPDKRAEAWRRLQAKYPAQVELLEDPFFKVLQSEFDVKAVYIALPV